MALENIHKPPEAGEKATHIAEKLVNVVCFSSERLLTCPLITLESADTALW